MPSIEVSKEQLNEISSQLAALQSAIAALIAEQPEPEPEPVEPTPEPTIVATAQPDNSNTGEWRNGISTLETRFILRDDKGRVKKGFVEGNSVRLSDGQVRNIVSVTAMHNALYVKVDGDKLPASVGYPNVVTALKGDSEAADPEGELPATKPDHVPAPKPGSLPIAGMCVAGLGNNPWLASINGLGNDKIGTHYRDVEEKTILEFVTIETDKGRVSRFGPGESWIARIDVALERFIDSSHTPLNEKYVKEVLRAMDLIHKHKGRVIIDVHNYMRYWKKVAAPVANRYMQNFNNHLAKGHAVWTIIGAPDCPITVAGFADFWKRMAQTFKNHPALLGYGLSNEPHEHKFDNLDVHAAWPSVAQACINSIRTMDMATFIMVGGNFWSSAKMWPTHSTALGNLVDPANKLVFEAHQYMDKKGDGGGRWESQADPVAADQGVKDWARFFKWLEDGNRMGYCGEVGGPATAGDLNEALENLYAEFYKRRIPWTQWRAGAGFEDQYANGMNRRDGSLKDNAKPLMKYLGKTVEAYGPRVIA